MDAAEGIGDKLAITTTIVLAIVLFQNGVDANAPKVSYLTFQVKYKIFCCEVPLFLMVVQNCVAAKFPDNDNVNWYTLIAWAILLAVLNVSFVVWAFILAGETPLATIMMCSEHDGRHGWGGVGYTPPSPSPPPSPSSRVGRFMLTCAHLV